MKMKLNKELIEKIFQQLDRIIDSDLEQPAVKFKLIAVGGTTLTLKDIKASTKDIDLMIDEIDYGKAKKYITKVSGQMNIKIDAWNSPYVFCTTLPYKYETEVYPKKYQHFDLLLLNLIDVAATKISRFNDRDKEDIKSIIDNGIKIEEIIDRYKEILQKKGFANAEEAKKNFVLLRRLFNI